MSPDAAANQRNTALRLVLAVTLGLAAETLRGAILPPLASLIAVQLLAASAVPPGRKMIITMVGVMAGASLFAYVVALVTDAYPGLYTIGVGLLYLWGFYLAFHPRLSGTGSMVLTMSIVVTALAAASSLVALAFVLEMIISVLVGFILIFLAHAIFPSRIPKTAGGKPTGAIKSPLQPLPRAVLATLIILPLHIYLTNDGVAPMVVLLTTATMLRQPGLTESRRFGLIYVTGNAAGALLATFNVNVLSLHNEAPVFISLVAASSLVMVYQMVRSRMRAAIFVSGLVAYTMLLGITLSPLPLASGVDVVGRVVDITTAAIYSLAAVSVLVPLTVWFLSAAKSRSYQ